jgi:hypothetical protein
VDASPELREERSSLVELRDEKRELSEGCGAKLRGLSETNTNYPDCSSDAELEESDQELEIADLPDKDHFEISRRSAPLDAESRVDTLHKTFTPGTPLWELVFELR